MDGSEILITKLFYSKIFATQSLYGMGACYLEPPVDRSRSLLATLNDASTSPAFARLASGWADENPALKRHYQPLSVVHFCSGRSDCYLGKYWKSR